MSNFRPINRDMDFLMPPSVDEWLPQRHLARFVAEVIEDLDLRAMTGRYRGSGEASYHPRLLLGLIIYGYATGVFSSRSLERATHDSVAFRYVAANQGVVQKVPFSGYTGSCQSRGRHGFPRFECYPDLNHARDCPGALHGREHNRGVALFAGGLAAAVGCGGGQGGWQERDFAGPHTTGRSPPAEVV
jgi:hypothetical protein